MKVGSERDVSIVEGCDFLLPIYAPDGWFDHQEPAAAAIPFELDTAHPDKRHPLEERFRQRLKDRPDLRSGGAARGGADIRWPDAELAAGKGTHCGTVKSHGTAGKNKDRCPDPRSILERLDPARQRGCDGRRPRPARRSDFVALRKSGPDVVQGPSYGFHDTGKSQFLESVQAF